MVLVGVFIEMSLRILNYDHRVAYKPIYNFMTDCLSARDTVFCSKQYINLVVV